MLIWITYYSYHFFNFGGPDWKAHQAACRLWAAVCPEPGLVRLSQQAHVQELVRYSEKDPSWSRAGPRRLEQPHTRTQTHTHAAFPWQLFAKIKAILLTFWPFYTIVICRCFPLTAVKSISCNTQIPFAFGCSLFVVKNSCYIDCLMTLITCMKYFASSSVQSQRAILTGRWTGHVTLHVVC